MQTATSDLAAAHPTAPQLRLPPIDSIHPDPDNPRQHSKSQIKRIARSIKAFGFVAPILVDGYGVIIAGHGRHEAARQLGKTHVPAISIEHLSAEQIRAYRIADNQLTDQSSWDEQLLAQNLKILCAADLQFDITDIGMDMGEIDLRIESIDMNSIAKAAAPTDTIDAIAVRKGPAITQVGDLWCLGEHRILCADSTQSASYSTLMKERQCAVVFTDPPYNVPIRGHVSVRRTDVAAQHREFAMAVGEMTPAEFTEFLRTVMAHLARHSPPGALHYLCMDFRHMQEMLDAADTVYAELKNLCVWVKNTGGMASMYRSRHELVFVFKHGKAPHINNVELGRHGRYRTNVWEYKSINTTRKSDEEGDLLAMHPTVKPVRLVQDALLDSSKRGDIVLDAFLGSGSTLIAAHRSGRICYGLELDPLYVDTAIARWQADTGLDAVLALTGETFSQREKSAAMNGNTYANATPIRRAAMTDARDAQTVASNSPLGYAVGYGKPPKASQFQKGQSGNPKGRPKGVPNAATVLREELNRRVSVNEGGTTRSITKLEAATKQLTNKAAGGDPRAVQLLFSLLNYYEVREAASPPDASAALATCADQEVQRELLRRFNQIQPPQTESKV